MFDIVSIIIFNEGGYSNLYYDDGTHTRCGITWEHNEDFYRSKGVNKPEDICELSQSDIDDFYSVKYIDYRCDEMPKPLAYNYYDHCINAGLRSGVRLLQRVLTNIGYYLVEDGLFGPLTSAGLKEILKDEKAETMASFGYMYERLAFYNMLHMLKANKGDKAYADRCLVSWRKRVRYEK